MKIVHLSDLHLGKRLNAFSMTDDQSYILEQILKIIQVESPDCVVIAGDVYDKSQPSAEAVALFDSFITCLAKNNTVTLVISGNHDSAQRIAFGSEIMKRGNIYLSPVYNGKVEPVSLSDQFGTVNFYMLPFVRPVSVRRFFPDEKTDSYTNALKTAVRAMNVDTEKRNVLIAHQFVTGAVRCESEESFVGGLENVDSHVFDDFDYVALGHIHGAQNIVSPRIRYSGTPLKYSLSEADHQKSVTVAELGQKGQLSVRAVRLFPKRDMREITGSFEEVMNMSPSDDFLKIVLTDKHAVYDALARLRTRFPNIMKICYAETQKLYTSAVLSDTPVSVLSPVEMFSDFFENRNGKSMSPEQYKYISDLIKNIWEEENETTYA